MVDRVHYKIEREWLVSGQYAPTIELQDVLELRQSTAEAFFAAWFKRPNGTLAFNRDDKGLRLVATPITFSEYRRLTQ
jgi:hypothetical protein